MKKILVPVDFSDYSINAFRLATYMAKVKGMKVKLLHIIEQPNLSLSTLPYFKQSNEEYLMKVEENAREHLKRLLTLEHANELEAEYEVRRSKAGIVKELQKEECDVIIMGRRRLENDQTLFLGSVAEKTVRLCAVPVITVGELSPNYGIHNIVFASDFEDEEQGPIIQRVIDLSVIFQAKLHFLYVVLNRDFLNLDKSRETIIYRSSKFDLKGHDIEMVVADTQEEGINQFIEDTRADLLALCTHGRGGLANFFWGSVAENMTAFASVPVLTYNIHKKKIEKAAKPVTRERIVLRNKSGENVT